MIPATWKLAALGVLAAVGLTVGGVGLAPDADPKPEAVPTAGEWTLKAVLKDHGQLVHSAAFAPDGKTFTSLGADGTVIVWNAATLAKVRSFPADPAAKWLRYRRDGRLVVFAGERSAVFDPTTGQPVPGEPVPPTRRRAPGGPDGVTVVDTAPPLVRPPGVELSALPTSHTVSPDGVRTARVLKHRDQSNDGVWLTAIHDGVPAHLPHRKSVTAVAWSPDSRLLASGGDGELSLWDAGTTVPKFRFADQNMTVSALGFTADGRHLLLGSTLQRDGRAKSVAGVVGVSDLKTVQQLETDPAEPVRDWAAAPDGNTLVAAGGGVRVFVREQPPAVEWQLKSVHKDHGQMVYDAAFAPDGKTFATAGADGTVIAWDAATLAVRHRKQVVKNLTPPGADVRQPFVPAKLVPADLVGSRKPGGNPPAIGLRFQANDELGVWYTADDGKPNEAWLDAADGKTQLVVTGADAPLAVGGGKGVFRTARDLVVRPLQARDGVRLDVPRPDGSGKGFFFVTGAAVSSDGRLVALSEYYGEGDSKMRVCDAVTGKTVVIKPLGGTSTSIFTQLAFSPDGGRLACGSQAGQVVVFDAAGWAEAYRVAEPLSRWTDAVAFTPDGTQLLVAGYREVHERGWFGILRSSTIHREVWVRDAATGALVQSLPLREPTKQTAGNAGFVAEFGLDVGAVAVSPDGRTLVVTLGSPNRNGVNESAAEQAAKAAAGEVRVYVRVAVKPPPPKAEAKPKPDDGPERNQDLWVWRERPVPADEGGKEPRGVAFTPDGKFLVTGGVKRTVRFWTVSTNPLRSNELSLVPAPADDATTTVAVAPNGKTVAFTRPNGVTVTDADPGCWQLGPPRGQPVPPGWEANRPAPAAPPTEKTFELIPTPDHPPTAVAFSPDGKRVAMTDGRQLSVREVGKTGGVQFGPLAGSTAGPAAVSWAPDGRRLVFLPNVKIDPTWPGNGAKSPDPAKATHFLAQVWGAGSGEPMAVLPHGPARLTGVVWAADGKRIVTADAAGEVVVWDGVTFKERKRLKAAGPVTALAMRADGQRFAAGVAGPAARVQVWTLWDDPAGDNWLGASTLPAAAAVRGLAFSPDGKVLAAGTDAGLAVWDRVKAVPKQ